MPGREGIRSLFDRAGQFFECRDVIAHREVERGVIDKILNFCGRHWVR